jgi:DNA-binding MarR family transcriptional regulator
MAKWLLPCYGRELIALTRFELLVSLASRIIQNGQLCIINALQEKQLGSAEANVLMFLYANGDGVKQDDIVTGVAVSKPAISRTVMSLEKKRYVIRKQSQIDKRAYLVYMTDKARREETFIQKQYADLVTAAAAGIPEEKVDEFIEIFKQVADNLDNHRKATLK